MSQVFKSPQDARLGDFSSAAQFAAQETKAVIPDPAPANAVAFHANQGATEMLKLSPEGFYVRGERVEQGPGDAQAVYEAFVAWMKASGAVKPVPFLTPADIEANIVSEHYFTALGGVLSELPKGATDGQINAIPSALGSLTFCVLILKNGAKVVGFNYGAIDPTRHCPEKGKKEAREMAVDKVWELMGYELRSKLAGAQANG